MLVKVAWSSIYLQLSSLNFLCSGLFSDILCLRFFLTGAYFWLLVNAIAGFPSWGTLYAKDIFILHWDVIVWSTITLYTHSSKFIGILLNERKVTNLPEESYPLYRMLYRSSGLSELLFQQFIWPRFELITFQRGDIIQDYRTKTMTEDDDSTTVYSNGNGNNGNGNGNSNNGTSSSSSSSSSQEQSLYIILDGVASATVTVGGDGDDDTPSSTKATKKKRTTQQQLLLGSGEAIHLKHLHLFKQASICEAFAEQTVHAVVVSPTMRAYRCSPNDIRSIAQQPQTKQAYQALLIFVLTRIAERAILRDPDVLDKSLSDATTLHTAFLPLEEWEQPKSIFSGSGRALETPLLHIYTSLKRSFTPPFPIIQWIPGLRHASLPAPHYVKMVPPAVSEELTQKTKRLNSKQSTQSRQDSSSSASYGYGTVSSLTNTNNTWDEEIGSTTTTTTPTRGGEETKPLL